jgi:two-component system, LuxR family, response regulator FixJ
LDEIEPDQSGAPVFLLSDSLMQPPARAKAMTAHSELSAPGFVVIVLDDDLAVRNSLKFSLEIEGFVVRSYATGAELLDAGSVAPCGCLVVDQHMPGMNGLDLIELLRSRHFSAPAILITSDPSPSVRERAGKASIPIVEKPLLGNALLREIRDMAGVGRS